MTTLTLTDIAVTYPPDTTVVEQVTMSVEAGELLVLLGPSGCGKTTILRVIAGLVAPSTGDVLFDGQSVLSTPPEKRGAVMVFQDHALVPFRTVAENVGFGLKVRRVHKAERAAKVAKALDLVQLRGLEERLPNELSGGQRQRVALARALVVEPRVLLLDEPLSSLDRHLREELGRAIGEIQRRVGITTIMVTHDQDEANMMADRVAVMIDGKLRRLGSPADIAADPGDPEVSRLLKPSETAS